MVKRIVPMIILHNNFLSFCGLIGIGFLGIKSMVSNEHAGHWTIIPVSKLCVSNSIETLQCWQGHLINIGFLKPERKRREPIAPGWGSWERPVRMQQAAPHGATSWSYVRNALRISTDHPCLFRCYPIIRPTRQVHFSWTNFNVFHYMELTWQLMEMNTFKSIDVNFVETVMNLCHPVVAASNKPLRQTSKPSRSRVPKSNHIGK